MHGPWSPGASHYVGVACSVCRAHLTTTPGSNSVWCFRCGATTCLLPPPVASKDRAELQCQNQRCRLVLTYKRGPVRVQCHVCRFVNDSTSANLIGHVDCGRCHCKLTGKEWRLEFEEQRHKNLETGGVLERRNALQYPYKEGVESVQCQVCQYITQTGPDQASGGALPRQAAALPPGPNQSPQIVDESDESDVEEPPPIENANGGGERKSDAETEELRSSLEGSIMTEKPNVKWDDVAGLEAAKQALKDAVITPIKYPQWFEGERKPWCGILLYGPPGTGKSYLAKAVATEAKSTFFSISSSDLCSKWLGQSEKLVKLLFETARKKAPSIIFIDEIDSICSKRSSSSTESESERRIKTSFMTEMQGVSTPQSRVLLLGATNTPYNLDEAIRRRFEKRIHVALPEAPARAHMFKLHLGKTPNSLTAADFGALGERTAGFSGSDVSVVVKDVLMEPVRRAQSARHFRREVSAGKHSLVPCTSAEDGAFEATLESLEAAGQNKHIRLPLISMRDFEKALGKARPTVSLKDLESHIAFTKEFGEEG